MTKEIYREDDMLSFFGKYLQSRGFLILALSGNQQGQYWFPIGNHRKAPDIIAMRDDITLIGEAKVRSKALFKNGSGRLSDYQSLLYLIDDPQAKWHLSQKIKSSLSLLGRNIQSLPPMQVILVGGDSFDLLLHEIKDSRIWYFTVDQTTGSVLPDRFSHINTP